jgi:hypothetical protein
MTSGRSGWLLRLVAVLVAVPGASQAFAQAHLYEHDNFQGRSYAVSREAVNLARVGFNDIASSLVIRSGRWQLCSDAGFQGRCVTLGPGRYPSLRAMGLNDQLSSLRRIDGGAPRPPPPPPPPPRPPPAARADLVLYERDNFAGRSLGVAHEIGNFASVGFNDIASSLLIRSGRWLLCSDAGFQGRCVTLGPGRYPSLRTMGLNDQLSSVRRVGR